MGLGGYRLLGNLFLAGSRYAGEVVIDLIPAINLNSISQKRAGLLERASELTGSTPPCLPLQRGGMIDKKGRAGRMPLPQITETVGTELPVGRRFVKPHRGAASCGELQPQRADAAPRRATMRARGRRVCADLAPSCGELPR